MGSYKNEGVVLKKFKSYSSLREKELIAKEASLLANIQHPNIVKVISVCESPATIMLELCQFSYKIFQSDDSSTNLNQFLEYLHFKDAYEKFVPKIAFTICSDLTSAISFMHTKNMVHRDIKPENCLVSNMHYSNKKNVDIDEVLKRPLVLKLGDLGESRSTIMKTRALQSTLGSGTKNVDRGTPAFMAPELLVKEFQIDKADMEQLKNADLWSLITTMFLTINPDQRLPYEADGIQSKQDIITLMERKCTPTPSAAYLKMQATQYLMIQHLVNNHLNFDPKKRGSAASMHKLIEQEMTSHIKFRPLSVSQSTALEEADLKFAQVASEIEEPLLFAGAPNNDGTNACAFLSLGIIDKLIGSTLEIDNDEMIPALESVIMQYPSNFNKLRDSSKLYDTFEAYQILDRYGLLKHKFTFDEDTLEKHNAYSVAGCRHLLNEIMVMKEAAMQKQQIQFGIFSGGIYIIAVSVSQNGVMTAVDTHPVAEIYNGNGNGLLVTSSSPYLFVEWLLKRTGCSTTDRPFIMRVGHRQVIDQHNQPPSSSEIYDLADISELSWSHNDFSDNEDAEESFHKEDNCEGDYHVDLSLNSDANYDDCENDVPMDPIQDHTSELNGSDNDYQGDVHIDLTKDDNSDLESSKSSSRLYTDMKRLTKLHWIDIQEEVVDCVPHDIDGEKHYVIKGNDHQLLLTAVRDGRRWCKDSGTNWSGFKKVRSRNCKGGLVCPNDSCDFMIMNGERNYHHFQEGLCSNCSVTGQVIECNVRKYTAFRESEAHVFHTGKHQCKATPKKSSAIPPLVEAALKVDPYIKPSRVQSTAVLDALRQKKPLNEIMKLVKEVTNKKVISNEMIKQRSFWRKPNESAYEAIKIVKAHLEKDPKGKFLIYTVDEENHQVFKTSIQKLEMARDMLKEGHFLNKEYCHFDGVITRVRDYVTLTSSVYHPLLCKQIPLATMECLVEDSDNVEVFWRKFNKALQEFDNDSDIKFIPRGWVSDMKGSNFIGLKRIYGDDILKRLKTCEMHFGLSVEKQSKNTGDDYDEFNTLAYSLLEVVTPEAFENKLKFLEKFIAEKAPTLQEWLAWWMDRRHHVFRAYRSYEEPKVNQQEAVHAGWKKDPSNVSLLDATFFDVRDSLLLVSELDAFKKGEYRSGSGANNIQRNKRKATIEIDAAKRFGEEIRKFPPSIVKAEDGYEPPKKVIRRGKQLFEHRFSKAEESKDKMIILDASQISEGERSYIVKNSKRGSTKFDVRIKRQIECNCKDFKTYGEAANCVHILFVMMNSLKCKDKKLLVRKQLSKDEIEALFSSPIEIPKKKPKRSRDTILNLIQKHPDYGTKTQRVELQNKRGRQAKCQSCKKVIKVGEPCFRVYDAVCLPVDENTPCLRDVSFCVTPSHIQNPPSYVSMILPEEISCSHEVDKDVIDKLSEHFSFDTR